MDVAEGSWAALAPRVSLAITELLDGLDLEKVSLKEMREKVTLHLNLEVRCQVADVIKAAGKASNLQLPAGQKLQAAVAQMVYLCAIARVLPAALEMSNLRNIRRARRDTRC